METITQDTNNTTKHTIIIALFRSIPIRLTE